MAASTFRPSLGLCLGLALGAHAAVLCASVAGAWHGSTLPSGGVLNVRMVNVLQTAAAPETSTLLRPEIAAPMQPLPPEPLRLDTRLPATVDDAQTAHHTPEPDLDPVILHWPDAAVPPGGLSARVRLALDANDTVTDVSITPHLMPPPYENAVRAAFMDRQMAVPAKAAAACVDVRFEPGAEPSWRWAGTADCAA